MGACGRACVLGFTAPQKLTFIFQNWSPMPDVSDLLTFSKQYLEAPHGNVPYKERPIAMRGKLMVVLPALHTMS
jgi:predicted metal-binding protein